MNARLLKIGTSIVTIGLSLGMAVGVSYAFHDGGVGDCDSCHTMHNAQGTTAMSVKGPGSQASQTMFRGNAFLLQGSDQSSTCLNCHGISKSSAPDSYHVASTDIMFSSDIPSQRTPAGDFGWLKISTSAVASDGSTISNPGQRHGHDIIAADFGFTASTVFTTSPGGSYPAANLHCTSCHDPHGRYRITVNPVGNGTIATTGKAISGSGSYGALPTASAAVGVYRLLAGKNYLPASLGSQTGAIFSYDSMVAVAPATYNRTEATSDVRVAYGKNAADWCANCHYEAHSAYNDLGYVHPAGVAVNSVIAGNYNAYRLSGSLSGNMATAYTSMVPFSTDNNSDITVLSPLTTSTAGMQSADRVICQTCHRTHASAWMNMTRWNDQSTFLTVGGAYPGKDANGQGAYGENHLGYTQAQIQASFYDRPASVYASNQRLLCNKCHIKD